MRRSFLAPAAALAPLFATAQEAPSPTRSPTNSRVSDAIKSGVAVQACESTMRNQKLVRADMLPAGVVQIIRRQQEGWAYLRP